MYKFISINHSNIYSHIRYTSNDFITNEIILIIEIFKQKNSTNILCSLQFLFIDVNTSCILHTSTHTSSSGVVHTHTDESGIFFNTFLLKNKNKIIKKSLNINQVSKCINNINIIYKYLK